MFKGILIRLRPVMFFIVVLAIALGSVPTALAEQPKQETAPSGPSTPTTPIPMVVTAGDAGPYYSMETITLSDGTQLERMNIHGPAKPPPGTELERTPVTPSALNQPGATASLPVPAYNWVFGCSAVSASMIGAYFDRNGLPNIYTGPGNGGVMPMDNSTVWGTWSDGYETYPLNPLIASRNGLEGRASRGSIDDYWVKYDSTASDPYITGGWTQHTPGDAFGDYMKTSQSVYNNTDGATYFTWWKNGTPLTCGQMETQNLATRDGTYGRKLFYEAHGISMTDCYNQLTDNNTGPEVIDSFSFADYKWQIDAGFPVILNLVGHSIVGIGYADPNTVYLNDTWDHVTHSMTWGGSYSGMLLRSVSVVNPVVSHPTPTLTGLNPSSTAAGGPAFTLTVNGTNFIRGSVVRWNGANRTTTYVSGTQLTAAIPAADIAAAGMASITVYNLAPGGGVSNALSFSVDNRGPTLTSLSPSSATPGGSAFTLAVKGTNFVTGSVVRWNGANRTTNYVSPTQLTAAITKADIAPVGKANVDVLNPDGYASNTLSFLVGAPKAVYLPLVVKDYPPIPAVPVLNAIANADGDGNYTVSWKPATRATSYLLQEDDNAGFASPETRYAGSGTSWDATGKAAGAYYYRVQAGNAWGPSGWSNVASVVVQPRASGPTPGFWQHPSGDMEFYVTADRGYVDDFAIYVEVLPNCGVWKITHLTQERITANSFSFTGPFYASGNFNSQTAASGTLGLSSFPIPGCGNVSGGPFAWSANWMHNILLTSREAAESNQVVPTDPANAFEVTRIP